MIRGTWWVGMCFELAISLNEHIDSASCVSY